MPVFPEVGSRIVCPGWIAPLASASSIMYFATRSLTDPVGLRPSSFAQRRTSGLGVSRGSSTSGVLPIASRTFSKWPPQGRLRSGSVLIRPPSILQKVKYGACSISGESGSYKVRRHSGNSQLTRKRNQRNETSTYGTGGRDRDRGRRTRDRLRKQQRRQQRRRHGHHGSRRR